MIQKHTANNGPSAPARAAVDRSGDAGQGQTDPSVDAAAPAVSTDAWHPEFMPTRSRQCKCCGRRVLIVGGEIRDDYAEVLAAYILRLTENDQHGPMAIGGVRLSPIVAGKDCMERRQRTVSLLLANHPEGGVGTMLMTADDGPFGPALSQQEALKAPFLPVVFAVSDFIVATHAQVRRFLLRGR